MSLTLLLSQNEDGSTSGTIRGSWTSRNATESHPVNSLGTFEKEFAGTVRRYTR